jgi:hypothetical protein
MTKLERQIRDRLFAGEGDDYDIGSSAEWLDNWWIKIVEKFGLQFIEYSHAGFQDKGVHVLEFEQTDEFADSIHYKKFEGLEYGEDIRLHYRDDKYKNLVMLDTILRRDDDSQPEAEYSFYFGTLFVMIPYFA